MGDRQRVSKYELISNKPKKNDSLSLKVLAKQMRDELPASVLGLPEHPAPLYRKHSSAGLHPTLPRHIR